MSTIPVSELKNKPARQWLKSAGKDDLVAAKDRPVAVLLGIAAASMESTRACARHQCVAPPHHPYLRSEEQTVTKGATFKNIFSAVAVW